MKKEKWKRQKQIISAVVGGIAFQILYAPHCFCKDETAEITKPLDNLNKLLVAIIGAAGYIILAKNIWEWAMAYQDRDSGTMHSAIKGIVAGIIMAGVGTVMTIMAVK